MSNYLVDKDTHTAKIDYMEYDLDGYEFRPKNQITQTYIKVKSVKIYKEDMISAVLTKKFERNFNRLGQIILNFLYQDDDDCNDSDFFILLDEVQRLRSMVEINYKKHLGIEKYKEYLEQLHFLDNQIRQKIAMVNFRKNVRAAQEEYNYDYEEEYEERKGRSR
jgi:hypothetical protein